MVIENTNMTFRASANNSVYIQDTTEYIKDTPEYNSELAAFEGLQNSDEEIVAGNAYVIEDNGMHSGTAENLPDGKLTYYKLVIPKEPKNVADGSLAWRNEGSKAVMVQYTGEKGNSVEGQNAFDSVFKEVDGDTNDDEAYYYPGATIFLLGNIKKCLSELQMNYIYDQIHKKCISENKSNRDFLFASIEVLKYLIMSQRYKEAQDILDDLSHCGFICENKYNKTIGCGCGR